ncbi:MAG: hypothetical protein M1822_003675 [Bathelium mastoideum]|nr:MAG: hypothetical protein M1822_003675 [Bathelium mastoideum]
MAAQDPKPFWTPPNPGASNIAAYRRHINDKFQQNLSDTHALSQWTIENPHDFWIDVYGYLKLVPALASGTTKAYDDTLQMSSIPEFFNGHRLNFAENVYARNHARPEETALIELREGMGLDGRKVTWAELFEEIRVARSALVNLGIKEGDRVAALVANSVWAIVLFLATASLGAIFTCISPDLGTEGCVSRLKQVTPSILFADGDSTYKGRRSSMIEKITSILKQLSNQPQVFIIPVSQRPSKYASIDEFVAKASSTSKLEFKRVPFNHPLFICYSSGTTGPPKCIVHQHGIILQLLKTEVLHDNLGPGDTVMQFTSTTWVVFYVLNGMLAAGATCICYDGSPMYPDIRFMPRVLEKYKCALFATSPRYLLELESSHCLPAHEFDLSALRQISTTGAPLTRDQYHFVRRAFPQNLLLANQAGSTDVATQLLSTDQDGPLFAGEMQCAGLGLALDVLDPATGRSVRNEGMPGELAITKPFPSMPCGFWGDDAERSRYRAEYFSRWAADGDAPTATRAGAGAAGNRKRDVWAVADWVRWNPATRGWRMTGRSDGVLNPSGIRFGSGEIYAIVEAPPFTTTHGVAEALCVGRRRAQDADEAVFLFVRMQDGRGPCGAELKAELREAIACGLSRRHVPRFVEEVLKIPVTVNGKKVEIAVKDVISGNDVRVSSTVTNPQSLEAFKRFRDLEAEPRKTKL